MISPTGREIRNDSAGGGRYGDPRGSRQHDGTDYLCIPGQAVVAPIGGVVTRKAYPYADRSYSGLVIQGKNCRIKLFYVEPIIGVIGKTVKQGETIGYAQDITLRYDDNMKPHIHLEIESINPDVFINGL